ncbi:MAG: hypothetical protein O3B65_05740 [Chloroflexi bacterium]|nr:hypothetical protein [Chloroflexota bacterium]
MSELRRPLASALGLVLIVLLIAACGNAGGSLGESVTGRVLVEADASDARWFDDVSLPEGGNGYELLEAAVEGDLEATFSSEFGSHFVSSILGTKPEGNAFWGLFVWNADVAGWEPSMVGADQITIEDGYVMGWAIIEFDPDNPQLPTSLP